MTKPTPKECPKCKKVTANQTKKWKYGHFDVEALICSNCKTNFREYSDNGKYKFTLILIRGRGFTKA